VRCFIALPLPADARARLEDTAHSCRQSLSEAFAALPRMARPRLSWAKQKGYHLTLAFLGEIEGKAIELAVEALGSASGFGNIPFSIAGLGAFPRQEAWRVLFAKIADGGKSASLYRRVNEALEECASKASLPPLNPEWSRGGDCTSSRDFTPHVTLARMGSRGGAGIRAMPPTPIIDGEWTIGRCSLYKSELRSSGAVYTEIRGVALS
jgi:2'-5' RNA ligase